ncbi:hypothetical protein [Nocardioides aquiterrae]|uniref:Uncharacterized protein n=1 Tax=Nocardioides aquiterrae TaxID=203799 RepID=A0ABN1UFM4_9ACTN
MIAAAALAVAITAHAPAQVQIDDTLPVRGHAVVADAPRTVRLQERAHTGEWYLVATERTRRTGWFHFAVSSGNRLTERTLRVVAAPSHGLPRVHAAPFTVEIVMRELG